MGHWDGQKEEGQAHELDFGEQCVMGHSSHWDGGLDTSCQYTGEKREDTVHCCLHLPARPQGLSSLLAHLQPRGNLQAVCLLLPFSQVCFPAALSVIAL